MLRKPNVGGFPNKKSPRVTRGLLIRLRETASESPDGPGNNRNPYDGDAAVHALALFHSATVRGPIQEECTLSGDKRQTVADRSRPIRSDRNRLPATVTISGLRRGRLTPGKEVPTCTER